MKATHWSVENDPERWGDNPQATPEIAVEQWLTDGEDGAWDAAYDASRGIPTIVEVHGYIETNAPLDEDVRFDGYEPGQLYFAPTGETVRVEVSLALRVKP
jgi:hypothetical protein